MLDGRVLGASQVEYKPFGNPPLKREIQHKWHQFNTSATCATCVHIPVARLARHRSLPGRATCPALKPRQAAEPPLSPRSLLYALNCFNMSEYMSDEHVLGTPGAPPCRATCPASEPCRARAKVGILPRKKNPVLPWEDCSTLFFANGCEAPGLPPSIEGLPPSILLSPQDCLLQSCCHPRIEGNSTRNSTRATPKKWDMPVSSSELHAELHAGQLAKKGTRLFPVPNSTRAATKKWLVPVSSPRHFKSTSATCAFEHHIPARHRRLRYLARHIPAALPARHRSLQPAKPAPRSGFFPGKKCRGCRLSRQPLRIFFHLSCGGTTV